MQGWRRSMEDAHVCAPNLGGYKDLALFGVFDGHGGAEVAQFCAKYLSRELLKSSEFLCENYDKALKDVFHQMDFLLCDESYTGEITSVCFTW